MSPGTLAAEPLWCTRLTYFQFSSVQTRTPHSFSVGSATPCVGVPTQDVGGWVCAHSRYVACIYTPSTAATAHRVSVAMSQPTKDTKVMAIHPCTRSTAPPHRTTKQHQHHAAHCAQSTMQHTVHKAPCSTLCTLHTDYSGGPLGQPRWCWSGRDHGGRHRYE